MLENQSGSIINIALQKFKKNIWGVLSLSFILLIILIALFAYFFIPDQSKNANYSDLNIKSKLPGFEVTILKIPLDSVKTSWKDYFFGKLQDADYYAIKNYSISKNQLNYTLYNDNQNINIIKTHKITGNVNDFINQNIYSNTFYLGTDKQGRDYLSRIVVGARVSMSIGIVAVIISLILGIFFGSIAGYYGGKIDVFVLWIINIIWSIPTMLLVIAITLSLGKGFWQVFIAVGLTMWVEVARVVRGQILSIKEMQYIKATKALGYNDFRIITKHILPNIMAPIIVISAANFASAILIESGLSFLGLGAQPPVPSWGSMIKEYYSDLILGQPHLALIPGGLIMLITLAFMITGNTLRDAFDVKS
ncbi:MAG: ABC transporter permease [Flavobacterium sp.]